MLAAKGAAMLDAPVSGGMEGAQTRDLLVMVGGDPAVYERARPLLDAVAKRVILHWWDRHRVSRQDHA
jgi:3-hydroxyisobutyrate dehydrogenase-like beta-hydroxyacid dehydrogenase